MKASRPVIIFWTILVCLSLLAGATLLAASLLPYPLVKSTFDRVASDGSLESFSLPVYQTLRLPGSLLGLLLLGFGLGGLLARRRSQAWLAAILGGMGSVGRTFTRDLRLLLVDAARVGQDRLFLLGLAGITAIALLVRLAYLDAPVRYDEAYTLLAFARRSFGFVMTDYHVPNNHIFHTLLVRVTYLLFGPELWSLRLPVLAAGVLLVPAIYLAALKIFDRYTALLSAALAAGASILVEYATNARGYMFINLFGVLILGLAAYQLRRNNLAAWVLFGLFAVLGLYTIPTFLYPFGMVMAWLFFSLLFKDISPAYPTRSFLRHLILAGALIAFLALLLYLPVFQVSGVAAVTSNRFVSPGDEAAFAETIAVRIRNSWLEWSRDLPGESGYLLLVGLVLAVVFNRRLSRYKVSFPLAGLAFLIPVVAIQGVTPWPRVWQFLLPYLLIWASAGLVGIFRLLPFTRGAKLPTRFPLFYCLAVCLLAASLSFNVFRAQSVTRPLFAYTGYPNEEEESALYLKDHLRSGDTVAAIIHVNYPLRYYFLIHDIPFSYWFQKTDDPQFRRAFVVVNQSNDQTLNRVLDKSGLLEFVDPQQARLIHSYYNTQIYEIPPR